MASVYTEHNQRVENGANSINTLIIYENNSTQSHETI